MKRLLYNIVEPRAAHEQLSIGMNLAKCNLVELMAGWTVSRKNRQFSTLTTGWLNPPTLRPPRRDRRRDESIGRRAPRIADRV